MLEAAPTRILSVPLATAVAAGALALAGCGAAGASGSAAAPYGPRNEPVSLSKCMRANGLSQFPDPVQGPGGVGFDGLSVSAGGTELTVSGVSFSGPALKTAEAACKVYLPPAGGPPKVSESQRLRLIAIARCIRAHGVPNFPDPAFGAAGPGAGKAPSIALSPAAITAAKACGLIRGGSASVGG